MENTNKTASENMEMHRAEAESLVKKFNALDSDAKQSDINDLLTEIDKAVKGYNDNSWVKMKQEVESDEDPMKAAVIKFYYPIIRVVDKNIGEATAPVVVKEVADKDKIIDLKKLHKSIQGGIGHNPRWYRYVEVFNMLLTFKMTDEMSSVDSADAKRIAKHILETFDFKAEKEDIDAVLSGDISKRKITDAFQVVIDAMLGEGYIVTKKDVAFITWAYGNKSNKRHSTKCSTTSQLLERLTHACSKLVTGGKYETEYRAK